MRIVAAADASYMDATWLGLVRKHCAGLCPEWSAKPRVLFRDGPTLRDHGNLKAIQDECRRSKTKLADHTIFWDGDRPNATGPHWEKWPEWAIRRFADRKQDWKPIINDMIRRRAAFQNGTEFLHLDVVNEAAYETSTISKRTGTEWIHFAFRCARNHYPGVRLHYSDFGLEVAGGDAEWAARNRQFLKRLLREAVQQDTPIRGVSVHGHLSAERNYKGFDGFRRLIDDCEKIKPGLRWRVSELDVVRTHGSTTEAEFHRRSVNRVKGLLKVLRETGNDGYVVAWEFVENPNSYTQQRVRAGRLPRGQWSWVVDRRGKPTPWGEVLLEAA